MNIIDNYNFYITIFSLITASLAWVAKIRWSKEFKEAKEAELKAKDAQIDNVNKQLAFYESMISSKLFESSKNTIKYLENRIDEQNTSQYDITLIKDLFNQYSLKYLKATYLNGSFSQLIQHEINTNLNNIVGFIEFIQREDISTEKRNKYSNNVNISIKNLKLICEDIIKMHINIEKQIDIYKPASKIENE